MMRAAALLLALAPTVVDGRVDSTDLNKDEALEALTKIGSLKSMDMEDVMCDECLSEIDCIWPCEIMCVLDVPSDYAGEVCQICLEFFGCEGCKFLCPSLDSISPSAVPSNLPTAAPTTGAAMAMARAAGVTSSPTDSPTLTPTMVPTVSPTPK